MAEFDIPTPPGCSDESDEDFSKSPETPQIFLNEEGDVIDTPGPGSKADSDEEDSVDIDSPNRAFKLRSSQKKRFKWLVGRGHTYEEALALSSRPPAGNKKPDFNGSSAKRTTDDDQQDGPSTKKLKSEDETPRFYSQDIADRHEKIGILPVGFPEVRLTPQQVDAVEKKLLELILDKSTATKPRFKSLQYRPGYLIVICSNQSTVNWVKNHKDDLNLPDVEMEIVEPKKLPQSLVVTGFFPDSGDDDLDKILR